MLIPPFNIYYEKKNQMPLLINQFPIFTYNENRYGGRIMKLCDLDTGVLVKIISINAFGLLNERLMSLGFIPGNKVMVIKKGHRNQLSIYEVSKTLIALRNEESILFEVDY